MTRAETARARATSARGARSMTRVALRLARNEPVAYGTTWFGWVVFFSLPLLTGLLVKVALDRVADGSTSGVWILIAAVGCWRCTTGTAKPSGLRSPRPPPARFF